MIPTGSHKGMNLPITDPGVRLFAGSEGLWGVSGFSCERTPFPPPCPTRITAAHTRFLRLGVKMQEVCRFSGAQEGDAVTHHHGRGQGS